MGHSIDKPQFLNGEHYAYWNDRIMFFIKGKDFHLWYIVEDGSFVSHSSEGEERDDIGSPKTKRDFAEKFKTFQTY
ncbi:hypothetical protein GQ457_02G030290 [Hibiscus cannabinus]